MSTTWTFCDGAITVEDTHDGYRASLDAQPIFWNVGKTVAEAIGNLIITHEDAVTAVIRATKVPTLSQAEAEALAAQVVATPGYTVVYVSERVRGWVVVVQAHDDQHQGTMTFTLHSADEWERRRVCVALQPMLIPLDESPAQR